MMEKLPEQECSDIQPIPFQNDYPIPDKLDKKATVQLHNNPHTHYIILYTQYHKHSHQIHLTC